MKKSSKRIWSMFLAFFLSLTIVCVELPDTALAATHTVHMDRALSHSSWGTYTIMEGDTVEFDLEGISEIDEGFQDAYLQDDEPSVVCYDPVSDMLQELKPLKSGKYYWTVPMGSAGMQTEFRFMFSNGDVYISDTYTIKPQPDLNMGKYTVDLRNGAQKPSGKVDLPNGFPESVAKTIINTIDAAAQFTAPFDELDWYEDPDEDVDDQLAYLDLDDDGSSDLLFTRPLGDSDTVTITPLAKNSIDGDYAIVLDEVARSYFNCRYEPYYKELTFSFGPALSGAKVSLSSSSYTYSGAAKKPAVTVTYGKKTLTKGTEYTVSYSNNVNAGKAKVTVTGTGKYHGKISKTFTIKAKAIAPKVTLSKKEYVFDGSVKKPTVTVKDGTKTLTAADYKVVYASGRKSVGSYKVTVTLQGNYSGTKSVSFKIDPKGTSLSSLTAGSKAITVKWKKQTEKMATTHVTGYEIQLATNSAFTKNVKKVTISGFAKYSRKVTGLLGARKYYVRIRTYKTIGDLKLYSAWSANKTVTTKK